MGGQEEAIKKVDGACLVLAGAGTGKTYTIVEKIKHLISSGTYNPERVVCITFSNEAANNLLGRVRKILPEGAEEPVIMTFHAFSADLLRKYGESIGISEDFRILTPEEAKVILHRNFKVSSYYCHRYVSSIGTAKDLGITLEDFEKYLEKQKGLLGNLDVEKRLESLQFMLQTLHLKDSKEKKKGLQNEIAKLNKILQIDKFVKVWRGYEKLKALKGYQDYSDLNNNALKLLEMNRSIRENYDYFIVDEFQDTNKVQLDLLKALVSERKISVVGDLNQSIYQFRGAYAENVNQFKKDFGLKPEEVFNLDRSFRSSNKILGVAHELILNNYENKGECFEVKNFENREGENVEVYELNNGREEARKVVELIEKEISKGVEPEEICVMFRTHQQGRVIKKLLEFKGISFCSVSKSSLFKQKSVRTAIDYLTILHKLKRGDKGGEQAWWDLIYQLGFLDNDLIRVGRFIRERRASENLSKEIFEGLCELELSVSGKMAARILIERIKALLEKANGDMRNFLREVYVVAGLVRSEDSGEGREVMMNLNKFYDLAVDHGVLHSPDLGSFLSYLESLQTLGIEIEAAEVEQRGVRLMTSHATKGLEYKTVIVTNLAQKRFPIEKYGSNGLIPSELYPEFKDRFFDNAEKLELDYQIKEYEKKNQLMEERRLCYVAFTRAKEKLILTYAKEYAKRKFFASQFLQEINYKKNSEIDFYQDQGEKYEEPEPAIQEALDVFKVMRFGDNFDEAFLEVLRGSERDSLEISGDKRIFSPSSLLLFDQCQKRYEYKYVYNMPEEKVVNWDAIKMGSFVHLVLEKGVEESFGNLKEFLDCAKELAAKEDWEEVDLGEAEGMIRVFYERNKDKFDDNSRTEQELRARIGDVEFIGFADRIDVKPGGLEIIDYKTGKSFVKPKNRNWQLGYYALASMQLGLGKVKKVTLDMLKQEKPLEFEIDEKGEAVSENGLMRFNIYEVEQEMIKKAHEVRQAYKKGFKACALEDNCEFCNEYVYNL